jgi:UDP-N-acetylmuramate dehydrogenase
MPDSTQSILGIKEFESSQLSHYRTFHIFQNYAEITSQSDLAEYYGWAKSNGLEVYILGNGSNTLFAKRRVKTLILKNKIPKYIKPISDGRVEVSSSAQIMDVLKYCYDNSLSSFYYLASVPASIGGALAMNAGRGESHKCTIYDFVESVTFIADGEIKTLARQDIGISHRQTIFTGKHSKLILSAIFSFEKETFYANPIQERQLWAKDHQDNVGPNCGSVFKSANFSLLRKLQGFSFNQASFSKKTPNWILNRSKNSNSIRVLIFLAGLLHLLKGERKKLKLEIILVD